MPDYFCRFDKHNSPCPDPVVTSLPRHAHLGAVSERLEGIIDNYIHSKPKQVSILVTSGDYGELYTQLTKTGKNLISLTGLTIIILDSCIAQNLVKIQLTNALFQ